jgi:hypothetical protein
MGDGSRATAANGNGNRAIVRGTDSIAVAGYDASRIVAVPAERAAVAADPTAETFNNNTAIVRGNDSFANAGGVIVRDDTSTNLAAGAAP